MANIGGKRRKLLLDIDAFAIPTQQRTDGESVPEVVHTRPRMITGGAQTDLTRQMPEDAVYILMRQWSASLRNEEVWGAARW